MALIRRRAEGAGVAAPGSVLGWLTIAGQVTVAVGLPLGGVLVGVFGWRLALLVNVPFALAGLLMTLAWIPAEDRVARTTVVARWRSSTSPGSSCFRPASRRCCFHGSIEHPQPDWVALAVAIVAAVALVAWELRARTPFFDVRALGENRALSRTYVRNAVTMLGGYCVTYGLTLWLQETKGVSAASAGSSWFPWPQSA